ncbi:hypothetical protein [Serpentinimonas maccroryi]|uniref:hypothetical protein n=1 Tax=Serpentinimonas maccroryi TaxID=1458426 RepID=UPI00203459EB|nr:hypothetical protein [Serpentinimonas maccroryi]
MVMDSAAATKLRYDPDINAIELQQGAHQVFAFLVPAAGGIGFGCCSAVARA